jgi:hypothetical protein
MLNENRSLSPSFTNLLYNKYLLYKKKKNFKASLVWLNHSECVGSFNMDWRILVFYPEPEARDNIY